MMEELKKNNQIDLFEQNGKLLKFAPNYILFSDGKIYSLKSNKFLRKVKTLGKTDKKYYYTYDLGRYGKHLVSRLVMFTFGKHNYKNITEMPKIILKNNDLDNLNISNLKFATQREINLKHNIKPSEKCYSNNHNQIIPDSEIEKIKAYRLENKTLKSIGKMYNTSEMSVHRFIKKYKIEN